MSFKEKVIYQIYPKSFWIQIRTASGIYQVSSKKSLFETFGVDMIWLSPIYPSPQRTMGTM